MEKAFFLLLLFGLLPMKSANDLHPIHLSLCEIHYNTNSQKLEISLKIFLDDLEEALMLKGHPSLYIATPKEIASADEKIFDYVASQFYITEGPKSISYQWVGKELSEDLTAIWCYFESEKINQIQELKFKNCILMELFGDQKNILHAYLSKSEKRHELFTQRQCK